MGPKELSLPKGHSLEVNIKAANGEMLIILERTGRNTFELSGVVEIVEEFRDITVLEFKDIGQTEK